MAFFFLRKIIITLFLPMLAFANVEITALDLQCNGSKCSIIEKNLSAYIGKKFSQDVFDNSIRYEISKPLYKTFYYEISKGTLSVVTESRNILKNIEIFGEDEILVKRVIDNFPVQEGDFYDEHIIDKAIESIQNLYFRKNIENIKLSLKELDDGLELKINLSNQNLRRLDKIEVVSKNLRIPEISRAFWGGIIDNVWDKTAYKRKLDEYRVYLTSLGYWKISFKETIDTKSKGAVSVKLEISVGERYGFAFNGNTAFTHGDLLNEIKKSSRGNELSISKELVLGSVTSMYKKIGLFYTDIQVRNVLGHDEFGAYKFFFVNIKEGERVLLKRITFSGNSQVSEETLLQLLGEKGTVLLNRGYLDHEGLSDFQSILSKYYISNGYIFSSISDHVTAFSDDGKSAFVTFKISENSKFKVGNINIKGISNSALIKKIKDSLSNITSRPFDVTVVDKDLKMALNLIRDEGYYFAAYTEKDPKKIVKINNATKTIDLALSFSLGKKAYFGKTLISGNKETSSKVISREIWLKRGDLVTPKKISAYVSRLRSLGLFSVVNITPIIGDAKSEAEIYLNFIIKVKETSFGRGELAPGYRTDLGAKVSTKVSYNNFMGMNRSWIFRVQANMRDSYGYLDGERRNAEEDKFEGLTQVQYVEPYLFNPSRPLEAKFSGKFQRKRYASFDADILSLTPSLTKRFSENFTSSIEYELDRIRQFDANDEEDATQFKIGSFTPSFVWDRRDSRSAPTKGFRLDFSWEFANEWFGSQADNDLTINYNKALLRTFFYYPVGNFVLATSFSLGAQKNFATEKLLDENGDVEIDEDTGEERTIGYIPKLKEFRLAGSELLRGFSEDESNTLADGRDLSDVRVQDEAYLINLKIEPRYYFSDTSAVAFFLDAGRIFVDTYRPASLRTSAGFSFKVLTPVGSLDFDYGVKLKRLRFDNGGRESFGRFHITIGQF